MKKIISLIIFTAMLLSMFALTVSAAGWDGTASTTLEGEGTQAAPYLIKSAGDLKLFADKVNAGDTFAGKYVKQTADIDLNNVEWDPIGHLTPSPWVAYAFSGVYDGGNHKVTGLKITTSQYQAGLFGKVAAPTGGVAGIANLSVEGQIVHAGAWDDMIGGIVGDLGVDNVAETVYLVNCVSDVDITDATGHNKQNRIGGVAGRIFGGIVSNVTNNGNLTVTEATAQLRLGGFVGQSNDTLFDNCTNNGNVTVTLTNNPGVSVAGFIGMTTNRAAAGGTNVVFTNCVNNGDVSVTAVGGGSPTTGGFVASTYSYVTNCMNIKFVDCVNTGDITGSYGGNEVENKYFYVGGIFGYATSAYISAEGCVNTGNIQSIDGGNGRAAGIASVLNFKISDVVSTDSYIKDCISIGKNSFYAGSADCVINCTDNAETADLVAALTAIKDARDSATGVTTIGEFTLTATTITPAEFPIPELPAPQPPVESGDASAVVIVIAIVSLLGVCAVKKIRVR